MARSSGDEIRISTEMLSEICGEIKRVEWEIKDKQRLVKSVMNGLDEYSGADVRLNFNLKLNLGSGFSGRDISSALSACERALHACSQESVRLAGAVDRASLEFETRERIIRNSIEGLFAGTVSEFGGAGAAWASTAQMKSGSAAKKGIDWNLEKLLKSLVSSYGIMGGTIEAFWGLNMNPASLAKFAIQGADTAADWVKAFKAFQKTKNFGLGYGVKTTLKKIFGLQKYSAKEGITYSKAASLITRSASNFKKVFEKGITNKVNWAVELIESGVENYNEYNAGYKDKGTAVAEWAVEGAGAVLLTSAGVAAAAVVLPASAPALLVGAVGGGIVWAVDTAWKNTIGKGKDEDGGNEGIAEYLGEEIVDGAKKLWNGLKEFAVQDNNIMTVWSW